MKIIRVESIPVRIPLKAERRMISALGSHDVSEFLLVRLETDEGYDIGETGDMPEYEEVKEVRGPASADGYVTPQFGRDEAARFCAALGKGEVLWSSGTGVSPEWPVWICTEDRAEK
jgi:hypothetical protein